MKAWYVENEIDPDLGTFIAFADTRNKARSQADSFDLVYDSWLDIKATRCKFLDDRENLSDAQIHLILWRDHCWRWWDIDYPDQDEATDEEFLKWYSGIFGGKS